MQLYQWRSDILKNYAQGYILAIGQSVEEARANALVAFEAFALSEWEWCFGANADDQYKAIANDYRVAFAADLSKEPVTLLAAIIQGSE